MKRCFDQRTAFISTLYDFTASFLLVSYLCSIQEVYFMFNGNNWHYLWIPSFPPHFIKQSPIRIFTLAIIQLTKIGIGRYQKKEYLSALFFFSAKCL